MIRHPLQAFPKWENHQYMKGFGCDAGEITPFVFKGRRYRVENIMYHSIADKPVGFNFQEDHFRIRDEETGRPVSHPLVGYYFATAHVRNDKVYVFASDLGPRTAPVWKCQRIIVITSTDLISWTAPQTVLEADHENLFNNSVTTDGKRFYMVYESDDSRYPIFTAKFAVSEDLFHWQKIEGGIYAKDKYLGGPALAYCEPWFYLTYVNCIHAPRPTATRNITTRGSRGPKISSAGKIRRRTGPCCLRISPMRSVRTIRGSMNGTPPTRNSLKRTARSKSITTGETSWD